MEEEEPQSATGCDVVSGTCDIDALFDVMTGSQAIHAEVIRYLVVWLIRVVDS